MTFLTWVGLFFVSTIVYALGYAAFYHWYKGAINRHSQDDEYRVLWSVLWPLSILILAVSWCFLPAFWLAKRLTK